MPRLAQRDRDRGLLQHRRQRAPQIGDHRGEAALQVVVPVGRIGVRAPRLQERGELARHLHQRGVQRLRMHVRRIGPVRQHVLPAVDRLQQQEIGTCATPAWPGAVMRAASASPRWFSMPDSSAISPASGGAAEHTSAGGIQRSSSMTRLSAVTSVMRASADAQVAGAFLGLQQIAHAAGAPTCSSAGVGRGGVGVVRLERVARHSGLRCAVSATSTAPAWRIGSARYTSTLRALSGTSSGGGWSASPGMHERRAVLEHAGRPSARANRPVPSRSRSSAYSTRPQGCGRSACTRLRTSCSDPAVLLLEVLRAQEHAFLPDHAVGPAHRSESPQPDCIIAEARPSLQRFVAARPRNVMAGGGGGGQAMIGGSGSGGSRPRPREGRNRSGPGVVRQTMAGRPCAFSPDGLPAGGSRNGETTKRGTFCCPAASASMKLWDTKPRAFPDLAEMLQSSCSRLTAERGGTNPCQPVNMTGRAHA